MGPKERKKNQRKKKIDSTSKGIFEQPSNNIPMLYLSGEIKRRF
jgi:hypothetical protein